MTTSQASDTLGAVPGEAPVRRGRGRPRDPETDERITTAAAELLLQRGFDRTTVDDVAARAGVGKATVYRRWPSKEDLAVAAMETLYNVEMPEPDTGDIRRDLTEAYRSVLAFVNTRWVAAKPLSSPSVPMSLVSPKNSVGLPRRPPPTSLPKATE